MLGPFPIFCRGHSGSRLLAEAYRRNGIWMGLSDNRTRDAREFRQANPEVQYLIRQGFYYHQLSPEEKKEARRRLRTLVETSRKHCPNPKQYVGYGWKRAVTTFFMPILIDEFPESRIVHLIRDGRDVMLSRLNARMRNLDDPLNRLVVFGDETVTCFNGHPLTRKTVKRHRLAIEMMHWVTVVRFARRHGGQARHYLEIRYEDLVARPADTLERVFHFLGVPVKPDVLDWAQQHASPARVGKWRDYPELYEEAINLGQSLLQELGYL